ncbi:serine/threonine-protein kinase [Variovorax sp. OV329]|uniref:serine/threonine protein kinase n=1 Tax=Variovorax sp. OV329 TaxID=1882825 RepID=UPI0008E72A7D|nr:serine/threonine-protein kinase [Variovorax sp. OV329]SFM81438.1 Serine/threonine protein kinase [Variovorax sp. OV329]
MTPDDDPLAPTQVIGGAAAQGDDATVIASGGPSSRPGAGVEREKAEAGLLPLGSRLAEFELTRVVGQGGFGVVYEAWDTDLERVVAVKEYLPVSLSTRAFDGTVAPLSERTRETFELGLRSFINEARLLAQFDHPSLLKVLRFWQEKGTAYMAMPFYRGQTLRQALGSKGGADEAWLMDILDGVTQALAVMHAANCYHRDIAPDNIILLEDSGRPVLLDFGAARRVITDKTQAITVILKPGYAPVEQYAEMPDMSQGAWTDVYALAAVMHVAITGRPPPPSVARLLNDSYVPLAGDAQLAGRYSARLLSAVDAGLGVRPDSRPQSMAELRALLGLGDAAAATAQRTVMRDDDRTVILPVAGGGAKTSAGRTVAGNSGHGGNAGKGRSLALAGVVLLALLAGGGWWWSKQGKSDLAPVAKVEPAPAVTAAPPAAASASASTEPAASAAVTPAANTGAPTLKPVTPLESLQALQRGATPGFSVSGTPRKAEVQIGKDRLAFDVRSSKAGFVYVFLLSSGNEMFLLFPNLLDKRNRINANETLSLPRPAWPMDSGGPPGRNEFAVLVSEHERDFASTGMQNDGVFPQFPLPALAALEAARGTGPAPLLGRPQCPPDTPCQDAYGVGLFRIVEK